MTSGVLLDDGMVGTRRRPAATLLVLSVTAGLVLLVALLGPVLAVGSPTAQVGLPFDPPSGAHPLGTDFLGRDALVRVLHGGAVVVGVAAGATLAGSLVGVLLGVLAGVVSPRTGELVVRVVDVLGVTPALLVILLVATGFPGSNAALVVAVALVSVPFSVRINRASTEQVARAGFVEVARARGDGGWQILRHDIAPNIAGPALSEAGLRFGAAIYLTSTAGFLGLGAGAPAPNWGRMVVENLPGAGLSPWPFLAPALLLVVLAVSVNLLTDELSARVAGGRS